MNGHARNMLWQAHRIQPTAMVLLSLILLAVVKSGNATTQCLEKSCSKNLRKGIKFSKFISWTTAELLKTYQDTQGDFTAQFCMMPMDSVPSSTLWGSNPSERAQSAYLRLTELLSHLRMVLQQQSELQPSARSLLSDLGELVEHTKNLITRVYCILQKLQPNVPLPEPAVSPTSPLLPQNIFQQKVYGCVVLTRIQELTTRAATELKLLTGQCKNRTRLMSKNF